MKKITQEEFNKITPNELGVKEYPGYTDYTDIKIFGVGCSFGEWCSFGAGCSFGERCSFTTLTFMLLHSALYSVSDKLILELMRRDASFHPDPQKFDEWAEGGGCPYDNSIARQYYFNERRELWEAGRPEMTDYELLIAVMKEKKWELIKK